MGRILVATLALLAPSLLAPTPSYAASVTLSRATRPVTPAEIAAGAPGDGFVHDFFVTSGSDILSINRVEITAPLFQHTLGSDVSAPTSPMLALSDSLSADSFITLPGQAASVGGGFDASPGEHVWFDVSNDGSQQDFLFARLTTTGQSGEFSGRVSVRGYDSVVSLPFQFALPGMESDLALLASEPTFTLEYSLDPPPPANEPPASHPTFPTVLPEPQPQLPPSAIEPPPLVVDQPAPTAVEPLPAPEYPTETPFELPYVDVPLETGDLILETIVPPSIAPVIGGWIGSVETFPVLWASDLHLWDGASLVAFDHSFRPFVMIDADGTTHGLRTNRFETVNTVGTSYGLSLGNSLLTFASTGAAAAEAQIPEPATAALAFSGIIAAVAAARRRR